MADVGKQMNQAGTLLVAAELALAGVPVLTAKLGGRLLSKPDGQEPQHIKVVSRTFKHGWSDFAVYRVSDHFDWLAVVILSEDTRSRSFYILPRDAADRIARRDSKTSKTADQRYWPISIVDRELIAWRDNFGLSREPEAARAA
jgi:hypothetical protein